ncbi:MAG: LamG domain-containing protein, partial [Puniceicoccales bacterium]|nr:LamG domain-containing protein [Puniceicoccales bacterium]
MKLKCGLAGLAMFAAAGGVAANAAEDKLIGRWTFDDGSGRNAASDAFHATSAAPLKTVPGVFGNAIEITAPNTKIEVPASVLPEKTRAVTFSAWIAPTALNGNIFRKEDVGRYGEMRLLMALQDGRFLTLGLNCGNSYRECDALISPDELLDGGWHLVTGTFDGKTMRVYLDGREIGSMERQVPLMTVHDYSPVTVSRDDIATKNYKTLDAVTERGVPLRIGSENYKGDSFRGKLDDARFYTTALSAA